MKKTFCFRIYRARFSEITRRSVEGALARLGQPELRVSQAVDVRQVRI